MFHHHFEFNWSAALPGDTKNFHGNYLHYSPYSLYHCGLEWVNFTHIRQGHFFGTEAIIWFPKRQKGNSVGVYSNLSRIHNQSNTKQNHIEGKTAVTPGH